MHSYSEALPEGWDSKRLKFNTYIKGRIGWQGLRADEFGDDGPYCVTGTDFSSGGVFWPGCYRITEARYMEDPAIHLQDDDLLVTKDGTIGKLAIVDRLPGPATLNSGVFVTRPLNDDYSSRFLYWVLSSPDFKTFVELESNGTTINHLFQNVFENFSMPLPSRNVQECIANFLDDKTARIDALIAEKERLLVSLRDFKRSKFLEIVTGSASSDVVNTGNKYFPQIPVGWSLGRVKHVAISLDGKRIPLNGEERAIRQGPYPYYGASGPIDSIDAYIFDETLVLVGEDGANLLSRNTPLAFVATGQFWVNNHAHILKPIDGLCQLWAHVIDSLDVTDWVTGSAQPKLTIEALMNLPVPLPPLEVRPVLEGLLLKHAHSIDALTEHVTAHINHLCEYRSSLISGAVTGQLPAVHK